MPFASPPNDTSIAANPHGFNATSSAFSDAAPNALAPSPLCSQSCVIALGSGSAFLAVAAVVLGVMTVRRRRQTASAHNKNRKTMNDDLMVEMFEPPEHAAPGRRGVEWRDPTLGLSPIPEEASDGRLYTRRSQKKLPPIHAGPARRTSPISPIYSPKSPMRLQVPTGSRRKLTIPYSPADVTRRGSLEGAW